MPYLVATLLLVVLAVALSRNAGRRSTRTCPTCHAPLGAAQIDCPVCIRR